MQINVDRQKVEYWLPGAYRMRDGWQSGMSNLSVVMKWNVS